MPNQQRQAGVAATRRPTQEERRVSTQTKVLDATIATLVERGYANTTIRDVSACAGVSTGALLRYWPTKADLFAAAAQHLFAGLIRGYVDDFNRIDEREGAPRIDRAIDLLWERTQAPESRAAIELYCAARTDTDLRRALAALDSGHRMGMLSVGRALLPEIAAAWPSFDEMLEVLLEAMNGAAMIAAAFPDDHARRTRFVAAVKVIVHAVLARGAPATARSSSSAALEKWGEE